MGRILKFEYYFDNTLCTECKVDYGVGSIDIKNYTDNIVFQAFGKRRMSIDEIDEFFRERCFPETRVDVKDLLKMLGLRNFDAEAICRKTHGMVHGDRFWIRFDDEDLTYSDIKKLRGWEECIHIV